MIILKQSLFFVVKVWEIYLKLYSECMWSDLSYKQAKTLEFIIEYIKKNSFPPTYQEIAKSQKINIKSVAQRLSQLKEKGYITIKKNTPRGISLTAKVGVERPKLIYAKIYRNIQKVKKHFKLNNLEKTIAISPNIFEIDNTTDDEKIFMIRITDEIQFEDHLNIGISKNDILVLHKVDEILENNKVMCIYENKLITGEIKKMDKFFTVLTKKGHIPIGGSNAMVVGKILCLLKNLT